MAGPVRTNDWGDVTLAELASVSAWTSSKPSPFNFWLRHPSHSKAERGKILVSLLDEAVPFPVEYFSMWACLFPGP